MNDIKLTNKKLKAIVFFTLLIAMVGMASSLQGISCQDCLIDISYPFDYSRSLDVWYSATDSRIVYLTYIINSTDFFTVDIQLRHNASDPSPIDISFKNHYSCIDCIHSTAIVIPKDTQYMISMINASVDNWFESVITSTTVNGSATNWSYANDTFLKLSGGNLTGDLRITDAFLNLTTNQTFNFDFSSVPRLYRNFTSSSVRTAPLATINMILSNTGGMSDGAGPAMIFWNKENTTFGGTEYNLGRLATVWHNKVLNESRADFYLKHGISDTTGLSPAFSLYPNAGTIVNITSTQNYTLETGNLKLVNLSGSGNAYPVRSDANGKLEVNRSSGAGITMKSPDGNSWCLTVTNGGTTLVASGACP